VSEKSVVMKENYWTVVLVVVHRVFYSHFIISLKKYDMVAKTFLYIIIILFFINKLNSSMSNFGGRLSQPKKIKLFLGISFFLPTSFNRWWIFDFDYKIICFVNSDMQVNTVEVGLSITKSHYVG
jgi:hypothetical protein